jgi:hypothetical protein
VGFRTVRYSALSAEDVQAYKRDGCLLVKGLYSPEEIEAAKSDVLEAIPDEGSESPIWSFSNQIVSIASQFATRYSEWRLFENTKLIETVETLTGWDCTCWYEGTGTLVIAWPDQDDGTWLHLDYSGEPMAPGEGLVYGMIYLTDVDDAGARTKVVPGSHCIVKDHLLNNPDDPRNRDLADDVGFLVQGEVEPVDVTAGDVLLFDRLLVHSGGGQQTGEPRPVLRVGFTNGKGYLADRCATVPEEVRSSLTQTGKRLASLV